MQLSGEIDAPSRQRAPRCAANTAETYRGYFRLTEAEIQAPKPRTAESKALYEQIARALGSITPRYLRAQPLRCERYLVHAVWQWLEGRAHSPDTVKTYLGSFRSWVVDQDLRTLDRQVAASPAQISDWLKARAAVCRSPRSVNTSATVIRSWFTWLVEHDQLVRSPFKWRSHLARVDDRRVYLRPGQRRQSLGKTDAQRLVNWCLAPTTQARKGCGVALLLMGLRRIEVVSIELPDITRVPPLEAGQLPEVWLLVRGKRHKTRRIRLEAWAIAALDRYLSEVYGGLGRPRTTGLLLPYSRDTLRDWLREGVLLSRTLRVSSHDLRRTNATLLRDSGADLEQVQDHLGHWDAKTTRTCYDTKERPLEVTTGLEMPA